MKITRANIDNNYNQKTENSWRIIKGIFKLRRDKIQEVSKLNSLSQFTKLMHWFTKENPLLSDAQPCMQR